MEIKTCYAPHIRSGSRIATKLNKKKPGPPEKKIYI